MFVDLNPQEIRWTKKGIGNFDVGNEKLFLESIDNSFLTQFANFTTYKRIEINKEEVKKEKESILDLILTSEPE